MSRTSVVLDDCLEANLKALARSQNVSMGSVIRASLVAYLVRHNMKPFEMPDVQVGVVYREGGVE